VNAAAGPIALFAMTSTRTALHARIGDCIAAPRNDGELRSYSDGVTAGENDDRSRRVHY